MKLFLRIFFFSLLTSLIIGFYITAFENSNEGNKIIGFTVLTTAFIFMPIFLVHRWKGKKLKDYTLSKENLEKLRNSYQK
jgi:hypothetical protein|tara:strand:- start:104 stop:343 length:240 start_codon:yes stop_codon:yes gene_type:complete